MNAFTYIRSQRLRRHDRLNEIGVLCVSLDLHVEVFLKILFRKLIMIVIRQKYRVK